MAKTPVLARFRCPYCETTVETLPSSTVFHECPRRPVGRKRVLFVKEAS